jgi:hypothetical protein
VIDNVLDETTLVTEKDIMNPQLQATPEAPAEISPAAQLMQIIGGPFIAQALYCITKLGVPDLLADGPKNSEYLAVATSSNENALYRVMRAVASFGILSETAPRTFANTPMSEILREDHPESARDMTIWMNEPEHWNVYGQMIHSVKTGETAWEKVHGEPAFRTLFETNRELGDIFNRAMTSFSHQTIPAIIDAYDFSGARTVADIAGGYGHLLAAVVKANPGLKGVLFELPFVLEGAPEMMESYGVTDRVEFVAGDFTESIPVEADIYVLKHIIHDWYDEKNSEILGNIRANAPDHAKVLIIDTVIPKDDEPHFGKIMDLEMLVSPGGMERTPAEFEQLLERSGFKMTRIVQTNSLVSIVEAVKA